MEALLNVRLFDANADNTVSAQNDSGAPGVSNSRRKVEQLNDVNGCLHPSLFVPHREQSWTAVLRRRRRSTHFPAVKTKAMTCWVRLVQCLKVQSLRHVSTHWLQWPCICTLGLGA
jgi:hypothetical protein